MLFTISGLFFLFLLLKKLFPKWLEKICALCAAVSLTWMFYLLNWKLNLFNLTVDPLLIALLMGQTILGIFYFIENKLSLQNFSSPQNLDLTFFRLPFLLTLLFFGYALLKMAVITTNIPSSLLSGAVALLALWLIFGMLYAFRRSSHFKGFVKRIVECCRKW